MMQRFIIAIGMGFLLNVQAWAAATLENPAPGALKSGVGVISGWVCDADELEVSVDGGARTFVPYGSERSDTASVCGDTDNGFGLLWNYNELGDGPHTVTLYVDGMIQTQVNFSVQTLGTNFLRGVTGQGAITLSDDKRVSIQWEEATQGFTITGYTDETGGDGEEGDGTGQRQHHFDGTWDFRFTYANQCRRRPPPHVWLPIERSSFFAGGQSVDGSMSVLETGQLDGHISIDAGPYLVSLSGFLTGQEGLGVWFDFGACVGQWTARKR